MPRPYLGPKLWLDPRRGTWTILDGRRRVRTGLVEHQKQEAEAATRQYAGGTYNPIRPAGPKRPGATNARRGVYVLGFDGYVKIGITTNVDERMAALQTPVPVKLYALLDGWRREELALHQRFATLRLRGEWFQLKDELADWIKGGCTP